ncbi:MAG: hypothetical protein JXP72_06105 [Coriobacteriia bacterium]|nr:hypothetical protein [Coriobacteriia bacterium]
MSGHDTESDAVGHAARHGGWDFTLVLLTVGLLGALGAQSLLGTLYAWWAYRTQPDFEQQGYAAFIGTMNAIAGPLVIALIVVMGLCVPKRLFARRSLVAVSAVMVAGGAIVWAASGSAATGIAAYLVAAGVIQVAVVVLTLAGARNLGYVSEGRLVRTGSGVLHLGFILFALVVVALQDSPLMLPVFAVAAIALTGGSVLAFYARSSSRAPLPDTTNDD